MPTDNTIRIYCDSRGAWHEKHGRREIATLRRRPGPEPDGVTGWSEKQVRRTRRPGEKPASIDGWINSIDKDYHPTRETVIHPDGELGTPGEWKTLAYERDRGPRMVEGFFERAMDDELRQERGLPRDLVLRPRQSFDGTRTRFSFRCRCGESLAVRDRKLWPILDRLAEGNVPEISVQSLRRLSG